MSSQPKFFRFLYPSVLRDALSTALSQGVLSQAGRRGLWGRLITDGVSGIPAQPCPGAPHQPAATTSISAYRDRGGGGEQEGRGAMWHCRIWSGGPRGCSECPENHARQRCPPLACSNSRPPTRPKLTQAKWKFMESENMQTLSTATNLDTNGKFNRAEAISTSIGTSNI